MSCIFLPSFIKQPEAETLTLATKFLKFPALFFKHAVCFCATLDRVISGTSAVYMVKPCFIRCLFCLEICGGSAKASNSNKNIKSSLTTQDISTAVFLSYRFEFLRCRPCFLSILRALISFYPDWFSNPSLASYSRQRCLRFLSRHNFFCVVNRQVLNVDKGCENLVTLHVRWCSEERKRERIDNMRRSIWLQRLRHAFLGGCVHPCELGSPPCSLLLTSGPNLSHL